MHALKHPRTRPTHTHDHVYPTHLTPQAIEPRLYGLSQLRRKLQGLRCVVVRMCAGSIPHGADELAPPILAAYFVLY